MAISVGSLVCFRTTVEIHEALRGQFQEARVRFAKEANEYSGRIFAVTHLMKVGTFDLVKLRFGTKIITTVGGMNIGTDCLRLASPKGMKYPSNYA